MIFTKDRGIFTKNYLRFKSKLADWLIGDLKIVKYWSNYLLIYFRGRYPTSKDNTYYRRFIQALYKLCRLNCKIFKKCVNNFFMMKPILTYMKQIYILRVIGKINVFFLNEKLGFCK